MAPLSHYMTRSPFTVDSGATAAKAYAVMRENNVQHLPVVRGGRVIGILGRREVQLLERVGGLALEAVDVEDVMAQNPYVVFATTSVDSVVDTMVKNKDGCAVAIDPYGNVVGIFTTTDAMALLADRLRAA